MAGRRKLADGGDPEAIEFSGKELDNIMGGASRPEKMPDGRGKASADAFMNQIEKGKNLRPAQDAGDVVMGYGWDRSNPGGPITWRDPVPAKKKKAGGKVEGAKARRRLDRPGRKIGGKAC